MRRKQASKSATRSPRGSAKREEAQAAGDGDGSDRSFERRSFITKGGWTVSEERGSSSPIDWRVGVVMTICLPLSFLIFWKVTLPLMGWVFTSVVGLETTQKLGFLRQDIFTMMTSECPMWLSAREQAFLDDRSPDDILRVTDVSTEELEEIVRRGEPVVITDALRDWEAFGLYNCGYFMRKFPKAEYFDWQGQEYVSLGNITKRPGHTGLNCASGYMETDTEANKKYTKEWLSKMPLPYFLQDNAYTRSPFTAGGQPSVTGFIGMPGTGVSPHLDETCDTIMTAQLAGVKNWSVSWPVRDGNGIKWRKPIVFTLHPGEAMIWYVAMRHHTEVLEGCSLSFSFLLKSPAPSVYFHRLVQDLASVPRTERDALFGETEASRLDYVDKCSVMEGEGTTFIT